ncbi:MAG TPA: hypothetical protein VK468_10045 [Pyrinomonadaceae bacterium]|nr:hypothetical protein [Pyrinomonadaceae bacterium]
MVSLMDPTLFAFTESITFTEELFEITGDETLFAIQTALIENLFSAM